MHSGFVRHGSLALVLIAMFAPSHAGAHGGLLGRVKKRVEENVGRQADRAVHCAMGDQSCIDKAKADGKPVKIDLTRTVPAPSAPAGGGAESGRVMMDGTYAKVYVDAVRVANVPNFNIERGTRIGFYCDGGMSIGGIRVAEGGRKLYEALAADGRVATQGIYFDSGSEQIRPESAPTLKEIAAMVTEHDGLRLGIEGHTDNVGAAATNLDLSKRRAEAVKTYPVGTLHVDASRLEATGFGATKPTQPNTTAGGRQTNRRVELVKLP